MGHGATDPARRYIRHGVRKVPDSLAEASGTFVVMVRPRVRTNEPRRILVKKKLLASVLLAASLVTLGAISAARAETLPGQVTTFEAIDGVTALTVSGSAPLLRVEGIVQGETQVREFDLPFGQAGDGAVERCAKFMLISQAHPGRYDLIVTTFNGNIGSSVRSCKLKSR